MTPDTARLRSAVFGVSEHVTQHLTPFLPPGLALVATPGQIVLMTTNGAPRAVATRSVHVPENLGIAEIGVLAQHIFADVQDLVVMHLHRPWPDPPDGRPLHAWADATGNVIHFAFRGTGSGEEDAVSVPPFVLADG